jgi:hypothetical protein
MKTSRWPEKLLLMLLCSLMGGCATSRTCERPEVPVRANYVVTVADDFVVDAYLNGIRIPDDRRQLLLELFGATAERINVQVHEGDWLVFHVVNDRLRWGGDYYFAAAGVLQTNEFGFVSELESGNWSACDNPHKVHRFIEEKNYLQQNKAQQIPLVWQDGTPKMKQCVGESWTGEPLWGLSRDTWLKVVVK